MMRLGTPGRLGSLACLGLLTLGLPCLAQDGMNFHVLGSAGDVIYVGSGAGSGSTPGVDAHGYWMAGEDMQGATFSGLTDGSGAPTFGYRQTGMRLAACVLNNPVRLDFPGIVIAEYSESDLGNGFSFHNPISFLRPGCDDPLDGVPLDPDLDPARDLVLTSAFGMPPGAPPASTVSWILTDDVPGLPSASTFLAPNVGLLPSVGPGSTGGVQDIVLITTFSMAITATGCFVVDLDWTATLGSALPARDNVQGWWTSLTASRDNNMYWSWSTDHLNLVNSIGANTESGATSVVTGAATADIEAYSFSADPVTAAVLAPLSGTGLGVYYDNPTGQIDVGGTPLNPGFDLGIAPAVSYQGLTGVRTFQNFSGPPPTLANVQDPAFAGVVIGPSPTASSVTNTLGFVTFHNNPYAGGLGGQRLTWVQIDFDLTVNRDGPASFTHPSEMSDVTFGAFPGVRVPVRVPKNNVGGWPQPFTVKLFDQLLHDTVDRTGDPLWDDPSGLPAGAMGIPTVTGSSTHLPIMAASGACSLGGLPVGLMYGTTGLDAAGTSLVWDPAVNRVSVGRAILLYD